MIHLVSELKLLRFRKKASVPLGKALPHPVPNQEKKGLCVCGESSVHRVHKCTAAGGREAWGTGPCPPLSPRPAASPEAGAGTGATGRRGPAAGRKRMLRRRGPEGGAGQRGPRRDPAGPGGRTSRPLSSASGSRGPRLPPALDPGPRPVPCPARGPLLRP